MIQCKPPVTRWCNNLSLAGKQSVQIKSLLTRIQYLQEVPGFRSAGHIYKNLLASDVRSELKSVESSIKVRFL